MGKIYINTVKYQILIDFEVQGIVDKHDIIGAIFGQSEGLIGEELDLRELQKSGKIGRIEVDSKTHSGKTTGEIIVPSSMDTIKTSLLAASIESVDKVGPCDSSFKIRKIEDSRRERRSAVQERAKELLKQLNSDMPETQEMTQAIRTGVRTAELKEFGKEKLSCGPNIENEKEIVIVEGRADVINLLKHGIKNVVAIDGAKIPQSIVDLSKEKKVTVFVDGDRGGELIARKLIAVANITDVARAPDGKEVEELAGKEILTSLRKTTASEDFGKRPYSKEAPRTSYGRARSRTTSERTPRTSYAKGKTPSTRARGSSFGRSPRGSHSRSSGTSTGRGSYSRGPKTDTGRSYSRAPRRDFGRRTEYRIEPKQDLGEFEAPLKELEGSLKARLLGKDLKQVKELSVRDLLKAMGKEKNVESVVFDGIVTKRLLEQAEKSGIKTLVGMKKGKIEESEKVKVLTAA